MARIGEGDPRWIVSERRDGANVNDWHWVEQDVTKWGHERVKEILKDLVIVGKEGEEGCECGFARVSSVSSISGDVTSNVRKGKRLAIFELKMTLKWTGTSAAGEEIKGKIEIPEVDVSSLDDFEYTVSCTKDKHFSHQLTKKVRKESRAALQAAFERFVKDVQDYNHSKASAAPSPSSVPSSTTATVLPADVETKPTPTPTTSASTPIQPIQTKVKAAETKAVAVADADMDGDADMDIKTKDFELKFDVSVPIDLAFKLFTDPDLVRSFTQSDVSLSASAGSAFSLFNGSITGTFLSVERNKSIVQLWRFSDWKPSDHESVVEVLFSSASGNPNETHIVLKHKGVPSYDLDRTKSGWSAQWFDRIRACMGFNIHGNGF